MKRESMKLKFAAISHISSSPLSFLSLTSPLKEFSPPSTHKLYTYYAHNYVHEL